MEWLEAGAVPELTVWGMGAIQAVQAHLLLSRGRLGLEVPSCLLLCLSSVHGISGWSQPLFHFFFSGVGHFLSCQKYAFLVPFAFCLEVYTL